MDGFEKKDSQGFENSYNSYERYPLEKFFIFTIYQNYTLALILSNLISDDKVHFEYEHLLVSCQEYNTFVSNSGGGTIFKVGPEKSMSGGGGGGGWLWQKKNLSSQLFFLA